MQLLLFQSSFFISFRFWNSCFHLFTRLNAYCSLLIYKTLNQGQHYRTRHVKGETLIQKWISLRYLSDGINYISLNQCCNEDWKWTEDEYEDSSYLSSVHLQNSENLWIHLWYIFNLRCNTDSMCGKSKKNVWSKNSF